MKKVNIYRGVTYIKTINKIQTYKVKLANRNNSSSLNTSYPKINIFKW